MNPISVLLVDNHPAFLRSAARFLRAQDEVIVVGTAGGGEEGLAQARDLRPDVILINLTLKEPTSLEAIHRLQTMLPGAKVIVLTLVDGEAYQRAALSAGADDFVSKTNVNTDLLPAIRRVVEAGPV